MLAGIAGLPNSGKTTLFNALTGSSATCATYRFTTIEPNIGVAVVPDSRLYQVAEVEHAEKVIPSTIKFIDVAGLIEGASKGEGLGNQFLAEIRNVDVVVHVLRGFDLISEEPPSPVQDAEIVTSEFIYSDIEILERRIDRIHKKAKSGDEQSRIELEHLLEAREWLKLGRPIRSADKNSHFLQSNIVGDLITGKPVLYVLSVEDLTSDKTLKMLSAVKRFATQQKAPVLLSAALAEVELSHIEDPAEKKEFAEIFGIESSTVSEIARKAYDLAQLISFFTTKSKECRAWEIKEGTTAVEAANKIHTDMAKGFIKAEVVFWQDLVSAGSWAIAREKGKVLLEGREYKVRDGDVITFKFSI